MFKKDKGFTLIELLVVIAIIGTLSGIVLVSLGDARTKASEAARMATLRQVVTAQQMIYNDNIDSFFTTADFAGIPALENNAGTPVEYFPETLGDYTWKTNVGCDDAFCAWTELTSHSPSQWFVASEKGARQIETWTPPLVDGCACF